MNYDLDVLLSDWCCPGDRICARIVRGRDGTELLQLRVDLGLLQMAPDGRPDGRRFRDCASSLEFVRRALRCRREIDRGAWQELGRELQQLTYRRLAFSALCDEALEVENLAAVQSHLHRTLRDVDACRSVLELLAENDRTVSDHAGQMAALIFTRARLIARARALEGRVDAAVEVLEGGMRDLRGLLVEAGIESDALDADPGMKLLETLRDQLMVSDGSGGSLREELEEALQREDYETAARLRDELRRRERGRPQLPAPRDHRDDEPA